MTKSSPAAPPPADQDFSAAFQALTGHRPFRWQQRLFSHLVAGDLPSALDLPTGLGKTSVMAIWLCARRLNPALPRRLVYVVDRRAVVDQATEVAEQLRSQASEGLRISTPRGQFADNREWLADPAAAAIIVGTVDMIGSRLLFQGYGVSRRMRPYHAGLLAIDSLIVLDEAHLVPPFEDLLAQIEKECRGGALGPTGPVPGAMQPLRLLPLSATGRGGGERAFRLEDADAEDPPVRERLHATKRLHIDPLPDGGPKLEQRLADQAWSLCAEGAEARRIMIYCTSRDLADKTRQALVKLARPLKLAPERIQLLVGARRVRERQQARDQLAALGFLAGSCAPTQPAFVVATAAGEVGVDLDADHLVMDAVPFERMVQRLGRVNRLGLKDATIRVLVAAAPDKPTAAKKSKKKAAHPDGETPRIERSLALLRWLPQHADGSHDASPAALLALRRSAGPATIGEASTPVPLSPELSRPLVDAWSMTSLPEHTGRPEVQPWLRGWVDDPPQTTVVWRRWLPARGGDERTAAKELDDFFSAAPPHIGEKLETESWRVRLWLQSRAGAVLKQIGRLAVGSPDDTGPIAWRGLTTDSVVAVLLDASNETLPERTLLRLTGLKELADDKTGWDRRMAGATLVLDARLGGLSAEGLLSESADAEVPAADAEDGWIDAATRPLVPFRVQSVHVDADTQALAGQPVPDGDSPWRPIHAFTVERDAQGRPVQQLRVDKWYADAPNDDARAVATRPQALDQHHAWTAEELRRIAQALGLEAPLAEALAAAAAAHDEGKRAARWQRAFHTPAEGGPYAKTGTRHAPDFNVLGGYRHEFGSLLRLERCGALDGVHAEWHDLLRHLVTAHHGRARPLVETRGCDEAPPSALEARAREVALRFHRLQRHYGPWGLAWLEALLRAADQAASRALDEEDRKHG